MSQKPPVTHTGIWGRSRSGKTRFAKKLLAAIPRVIVFDLMDEYDDVMPTRAGSIAEVKAALRAGWSSGFGVRYVPPDVDPAGCLDALAKLVRLAQLPYRDGAASLQLTLAVDELSASFPNVRNQASEFGMLCSRGSHYGVNVLGTSQRPAEVSTTFRGNTMVNYYFALADHNDIKAAAEKLGPENARKLLGFSHDRYLRHDASGVVEGVNN